MNEIELMVRRNITARKYRIPKTANLPRQRNAVFINTRNTFEHEFEKFKLAFGVQKAGMEFITEAEDKETGEVADFVVLDLDERHEFETDESRAKRFKDRCETVHFVEINKGCFKKVKP